MSKTDNELLKRSAPGSRASHEQPSLSIREASRLLGVSEVTLRYWTDEGRIPAFLTPGGHRRYRKAALQELMGKQQRTHGVKDLIARIEDTTPLYHQIAQASFLNTSWYSRLDSESQRRLAELGRRLLHLVISYLSTPPRRQETARAARQAGYELGRELARLGLSLNDSLEAFVMHRNPATNAATDLIKKGDILNKRALDAIPLVTQVMDEVMLSLVMGHQSQEPANPGPYGEGAGL